MDRPNGMINGVAIAAILTHRDMQPELVQRVAHRKVPAPELAIVDPDPSWPEHFKTFRSNILAAFGQEGPSDDISQRTSIPEVADGAASGVTILSITHVGSTSVPNLPAKAVIDIDVVLSNPTLPSEELYVPRLESAGFQFLLREPAWYEHRFFVASEPMPCNLHIFGPHCAEVERHRIFRDWLAKDEADRQLYARVKRESAEISRDRGEVQLQYNARKERVLKEILTRAFRDLGYVE